jgi:hypothetical protein
MILLILVSRPLFIDVKDRYLFFFIVESGINVNYFFLLYKVHSLISIPNLIIYFITCLFIAKFNFKVLFSRIRIDYSCVFTLIGFARKFCRN